MRSSLLEGFRVHSYFIFVKKGKGNSSFVAKLIWKSCCSWSCSERTEALWGSCWVEIAQQGCGCDQQTVQQTQLVAAAIKNKSSPNLQYLFCCDVFEIVWMCKKNVGTRLGAKNWKIISLVEEFRVPTQKPGCHGSWGAAQAGVSRNPPHSLHGWGRTTAG